MLDRQIDPVNSRRADSILEELEQSIVLGEFADGERLDEVKLSERYNVSRTPIREAFQKLAATGLLNLIPRRGAFVRHPEFVELIEMFEVMAELEAMCGRLAARRISDDMLGEIKQSAAECEEALKSGDRDEYYDQNEQFHHLIYEASGNSFLASEASRLQKRLKPFRRMQLRVRGRMKQSMEQHRQIVLALETGNSEIAGSTLHEHVAIQGEKFNDLMASYSTRSHQSAGKSTLKIY
ncbi:MAG: GntR family transcriptional regulator [Rhizobiaceae bacterium]|nr:GntR family transcriptional regulator [Rhizobiaceae bacterium]